MFDDLKEAWQVRALHKERAKLQLLYKNALREAKAAGKSQLELDRIFFEERMEVETVDAEIRRELTQRLIRLADRYFIPRPEFSSTDGTPTQSGVNGRWHMTTGAIAELRSAVRREKKERWESLRMWL